MEILGRKISRLGGFGERSLFIPGGRIGMENGENRLLISFIPKGL